MNAPARIQGRFAPGTSGNGHGRPKGFAGLARAIRERTCDGEALLDFALKVLQSDAEETRDRIAALQWLGDRGWGKALQAVELSLESAQPAANYDMSKLSVEERRELLGKIRALKSGEGTPDDHEE